MPKLATVLFVTRKWAPAVGGMETWSQRMAEQLALLAPLHVVALPGRSGGRPPAAWRLLLFPFAVLRALLATRPATVHLGDMALWPLALMTPQSTRIVLSAHGTDVSYHRRGGLRARLYGAYLRLGAHLLPAASVIANSAATSAAAEENGWRVARVVPLGTDMHREREIEEEAAHDGHILFAGRLIAQKGCGWFVREVLPLLPENVRLRVAGTVVDAEEQRLLASSRVDFLGPLAPRELAQAYARAACVVVPNIERPSGEFEGFGLVACEAASCGGIVLAARTGGLVEAVREGETGFLLPSGDARAWAEAITRITLWPGEERAAFVARAGAGAQTHYSWARVARDTAAHYRARA